MLREWPTPRVKIRAEVVNTQRSVLVIGMNRARRMDSVRAKGLRLKTEWESVLTAEEKEEGEKYNAGTEIKSVITIMKACPIIFFSFPLALQRVTDCVTTKHEKRT